MQGSYDEPFNFVLLDGTWSNSAALYRRLKVQFQYSRTGLRCNVFACFWFRSKGFSSVVPWSHE
jgi:hypothetical protein